MESLARAFYEHVADDVRAQLEPSDPAAFGEALRAFIARGRLAWPKVIVDDVAFACYAAQRFQAGQQLASTHAEGLLLAFACSQNDDLAMKEFESSCGKVMNACYRRLGFLQFAEEITQGVMRAMFVDDRKGGPAIFNYNGRGSLSNWVRVVTVREAYRVTRKERKREKREIGGVDERIMDQAVFDEANPEMLHLKRDYRTKFKQSFQRAFERLDHRERNILRYQYLDGLNLEQIGTIYDASRATVARWRAKARARLLAETRKVMRDEFDVPLEEFDGAIRLIESAMDVSLSRLLHAVAKDSPS